jgi:predicted HAD superfamily Cof-like phosphohydrolase
MAVLRRRLLREELEEYCTADNLEEQLDALVDLMYVLLGTAYLHGFNRFGEAWSRIQAANMLKVRATVPEDSPRGSTLDVVKPPGWSPASLTDLVSAD